MRIQVLFGTAMVRNCLGEPNCLHPRDNDMAFSGQLNLGSSAYVAGLEGTARTGGGLKFLPHSGILIIID